MDYISPLCVGSAWHGLHESSMCWVSLAWTILVHSVLGQLGMDYIFPVYVGSA